MTDLLAGKASVVTGAGQGIGRGIALMFSDEGAKVAVVDLDGALAESVAKEVSERGGEAIRTWITTTMAQPVNCDMRFFPIEWYVIDEERGWVVCQVWNRMIDPGDGSLHQAYNFTLLKYAGEGKWSYEEDIYNPGHFKEMVVGWLSRRDELEAQGEG